MFLILLSSAYSQENLEIPRWYENYDRQLQEIWRIYQPVAMVAVLLSFFVASLLYGFGIILNNERLRNYGMAEFLESAASLLMVIFFLLALQILVNVFYFPAQTESGTTPEQKQVVKIGPFAYLDAKLALIQKTANKTFTALATTLYYLSMISSFELSSPGGVAGSSSILQYAQPIISGMGGGLAIYQRFLNTFITPFAELADFTAGAIRAISLQRALLKFFAVSALMVFLPLGVVLRIFPPTRGAGGMLIAIAFSFFFIFPFTYLIFYLPSGPNSIYGILMSNLYDINKQLDEINSKLIPFSSATGTSGFLALISILYRLVDYLLSFVTVLAGVFGLLNLFIAYFPTFFFVLSLLPLIAGTAALTFMVILSDLFGENAVDHVKRWVSRMV
jgi:hypothetical protein